MDFSFTDDQLLFRDAVRALLTDRCPPANVRAAWDDAAGPGFDRDLWAALAEMGILGLLAPESSGGLGLSMIDLVLLLEETGRAALPGPIVEHAAVAVPALVESGHPALAEGVRGEKGVSAAVGRRACWVGDADLLVVADGDTAAVVAADAVKAEARQSVDHSRRPARLDGASVAAGGSTAGTEQAAPVDAAAMVDRGALGVAAQLVGLA